MVRSLPEWRLADPGGLAGGRLGRLNHNLLSANMVELPVVTLGEINVANKIPRKVHAELASSKGADFGGVPATRSAPVDVSTDNPRAFGVEKFPATVAATESRQIPHYDPLAILRPVYC